MAALSKKNKHPNIQITQRWNTQLNHPTAGKSPKNTYHLINLFKKNTQQFHLRNWKKSPNKFIQGTETHMLQQILRLRFQLSLTTLQQALSHLFEGFFLQLVRVDPQPERVSRHHGAVSERFPLTSPKKIGGRAILTLLYFGGFKFQRKIETYGRKSNWIPWNPKF